VGERGARLSGGQRQRIALARALYKQPSLLILDEATSAIDIETESRVVNNLHQFAIDYNLTQVIVAHKKSSLIYCDSLYFVDSGVISKIDNKDEFDLN
jgi:ABC-type bacteriocin/lantibiotic exporter with double-glycine peptidase domain